MDKQYAEKCGYHTIKEISDKIGVARSWVYKNIRRFKILPVWTSGRLGDNTQPDLYRMKDYLESLDRRKAFADIVAVKCASANTVELEDHKQVHPSPSTIEPIRAPVGRVLTQEQLKSVKAPSAKFLKINSVEKDYKAANIDRFDEVAVKRNIDLLVRKGLKPLVIAHRLGLPLVDVENYCSK